MTHAPRISARSWRGPCPVHWLPHRAPSRHVAFPEGLSESGGSPKAAPEAAASGKGASPPHPPATATGSAMWPDWLGDIPWRTIGAFAAGLAGGGLVAVAVRRARGEGSSSVPSAPDRAEDAPVERSPRPSGEMVVRETPGASPGRRLLPWLGGEASTPESLIYGSAIALLLFVVVAAVTALVSMTLPSSFPLFGPVVSALLGVHVLALRDADCRRDAACASEPAAAQAPSQAPRLREGAGERPGAPQPAAEASGPSAPTGEVSPEAEGAVSCCRPYAACPCADVGPVSALFAEVSTALDAGGDLRTEYLPRLQAIEADHSAPAVRCCQHKVPGAMALVLTSVLCSVPAPRALRCRRGSCSRRRRRGRGRRRRSTASHRVRCPAGVSRLCSLVLMAGPGDAAVDKARGAIGIDERYFGGHKW